MIDLNDLYYFSTLAEQGSFTKAAERLDIPKGSLSRRLQSLEKLLGLRLIDRTTRRFSLTEAGTTLFLYAQKIVEEAKSAESTLRQLLGAPAGRVRITCPQGLLRTLLTPLLPKFLAQYPNINVNVVASHRYMDLIAEGFDLGLRAHENDLADTSLIARRLTQLHLILVASPLYIKHHPLASPDDLDEIDGLHPATHAEHNLWTICNSTGQKATLRFNLRLSSDDMTLLKAAAVAGQGVAAIPLHLCHSELSAGTLVRVLPEWEVSRQHLSLILPAQKGLMPAVRACADFLIEHIPELVEGSNCSK